MQRLARRRVFERKRVTLGGKDGYEKNRSSLLGHIPRGYVDEGTRARTRGGFVGACT